MPFFFVPVISALVGLIIPALKALIESLQQNLKVAQFLRSSFGAAILKAFGLDQTKDTTEGLFKELNETSTKMDSIFVRIHEYTQGRTQSVTALEQQLGLLTEQETELKKRIEALKQVSVPAAEYLAAVVKKEEKAGVARDYVLFALGVVVSAVVTIILKHFNLA